MKPSAWFAKLSPLPLLRFILHPGQVFQTFREEDQSSETPRRWLPPMLLLSLTLIARLYVNGRIQARLAALGESPLPTDWQWWTPEMQTNYTQAMQVTQGPVFLYIIPIALGLISLWLGWLTFGATLHLASTLLGGRGSMQTALNVAAWGALPFALRDILRIGFMYFTRSLIEHAGLSGFSDSLFLGQLLGLIDFFLLWSLVLLVLGMRATDSLSTAKAWGVVISVSLLSLLAQALLTSASSNLSKMMITRPFF